jgi:hypothetical protein
VADATPLLLWQFGHPAFLRIGYRRSEKEVVWAETASPRSRTRKTAALMRVGYPRWNERAIRWNVTSESFDGWREIFVKGPECFLDIAIPFGLDFFKLLAIQ